MSKRHTHTHPSECTEAVKKPHEQTPSLRLLEAVLRSNNQMIMSVKMEIKST